MMKRNAHLCTVLAGAWLLFSAFALFDWRDAHRQLGEPYTAINLGIWSIQLLLVWLALYFSRTEAARELLWIGDSAGYAVGFVHLSDMRNLFFAMKPQVPELTERQIEQLVEGANSTMVEGDAVVSLPMRYRERLEQFEVSFEAYGDEVLVSIRTHADLANDLCGTLEKFEVPQPAK